MIVLWDWNGTLIDDMALVHEVYRYTCAFFRAEPLSISEYNDSYVRTGDYIGIYRDIGVTAPREEINKIYRPRYDAELFTKADLFAGVVPTLKALQDMGVEQGIVTCNWKITEYLRFFGIESFFKKVVWGMKDKTDTLRTLTADASRAFYVGDSPRDVRAANAANVQSVAFMTDHVPHFKMLRERPSHYIFQGNHSKIAKIVRRS